MRNNGFGKQGKIDQKRARHNSGSLAVGDCSGVASWGFTLSSCGVHGVLPPEEKCVYKGTKWAGNLRVGGRDSPSVSVSCVKRPWKARLLTQEARNDTFGSSSLHNPLRPSTTPWMYFFCNASSCLLNVCLVLALKIVRKELTQASTRVVHASSESSKDVAHDMKCSLIRFRMYSSVRTFGK